MMDAEGRIIEIVEDDQGEGWAEPLSKEDIEDQISELSERLRKEHYKFTQLKHKNKV
jgi:hypothetical protein